MSAIGIIGGSGLTRPPELEASIDLATPFGDASGPVHQGVIAGHEVVFLPRHGVPRQFAPHAVNFRANLWKLRALGARHIIALSCVGAINPSLRPGDLVMPDQLIDYTYGRAHSLYLDDYPEDDVHTGHFDFSEPFTSSLRETLLAAASGFESGRLVDAGCYGVTQGPRFETAAEIRRMAKDGCDVVGMTLMPEASLARELDLAYAALCPVVNMAAGCGDGAVEIEALLALMAEFEPELLGIVRRACETLTMPDWE